MADGIPGVDDLRRESEVSDDGIEAATAAYLADQDAKAFALESCPMIDVATAIEMHPQARKRVADAATMPGLRCTMVQTAVVTSDEVPPRRWRGGGGHKTDRPGVGSRGHGLPATIGERKADLQALSAL